MTHEPDHRPTSSDHHQHFVSAQFIHFHPVERTPMYERLANAVAPGGTLLIVGHHPSDLETTSWRMPDPEPLLTAEGLAADLGRGWTIVAEDSRPRTEADRHGESITVHDAVMSAKRSTDAR